MNVNRENQLTYEELAEIFEITPNKAHQEVKKVYNKIIKELMKKHKLTIWEAVILTKKYFGMSEKEAVDKLNLELSSQLKEYATEHFQTSVQV